MTRKITFEEAKRRFTNRFTMEHVPDWAFKGVRDGATIKHYAPQFATDLEWFEKSLFHGDKDHTDGPGYCLTRGQTWPLGEWLSKPYRKVDMAA